MAGEIAQDREALCRMLLVTALPNECVGMGMGVAVGVL
jgi:hypothetical protein